ncbi:hypothetical protein OG21DRAFT_1510468 [Imleria badia]|nr:hypothetical protein OG21DRAFT_1510468 [Imleria badia]
MSAGVFLIRHLILASELAASHRAPRPLLVFAPTHHSRALSQVQRPNLCFSVALLSEARSVTCLVPIPPSQLARPHSASGRKAL